MDTAALTGEQETLLVPLVCKAEEMKRKRPLLIDPKAAEIVARLDYDFKHLKVPEKTCRMMCLRAKLIDNLAKDFLQKHGDAVGLHLGCGLDSRYERIGDPRVDWYDIDFEKVIELRRRFFSETDRYHMISSSVTDKGWLERIPQDRGSSIVVAEGLFMYLGEDEVRSLIDNIRKRIGEYTLIFDAFSTYTARRVKDHPSIRRTGATVKWGIDNPQDLAAWGPAIRLVKEVYFTSNEELENLDAANRMMYKIAGAIPPVRRAQRILVFQVGEV